MLRFSEWWLLSLCLSATSDVFIAKADPLLSRIDKTGHSSIFKHRISQLLFVINKQMNQHPSVELRNIKELLRLVLLWIMCLGYTNKMSWSRWRMQSNQPGGWWQRCATNCPLSHKWLTTTTLGSIQFQCPHPTSLANIAPTSIANRPNPNSIDKNIIIMDAFKTDKLLTNGNCRNVTEV